MMRIGHVLFGGLGGHGSVVFSLIDASEGQAEHVLAFVSRGGLLDTYRDECESRQIQAIHIRAGGTAGIQSHVQVANWLRRHRPDAVLVHSGGYLPAALIARIGNRLRCEIVLVEHQSWPLRTRRHRLTTMLALATRTPIVVLTASYAAALKAAHPKMSTRSDITVIPNGINLDRFSPYSEHKGLGDPAIVGMQSRLITIKDHPTLLRAAADLVRDGTSLQVRLAGDGPSRSSLESLAGGLGISKTVHFLGILGEAEIADFLRGLDVYVHASLGEAMSTALLQAFAAGIPVIASDVSGIREMVQGQDVAILVPPQDSGAMADAIRQLLADEGKRACLARRGRDFVASRYSNTGMWRAYQGVLQRQGRPL
jgi:glycosyltransferase involved in cell wall biosynthesis